mgnify:CR=1 FL=1
MSAPSARGLFRATGKRARPAVVRDLVTGEDVVHPDGLPREANDFYPTPSEATTALALAEAPWLARHPVIWEPACGDGRMMADLRRHGHEVVGSDLVDRGCGAVVRDFFAFSEALAPAIVTNPPFAPCNRDPGFVRHALDGLRADYMALLLPVNWMGAASRARLWRDHPPARVRLMRWRIDFTGQGAPPMINAWFVWERGHRGGTELSMLDRPAPAGLFDGEGEAAE